MSMYEPPTDNSNYIDQLEFQLKQADQRIAALEAENERLKKQVSMDTTRTAEMEQHGLELEAELTKLKTLAQAVSTHRADHYRRTNNKEGTGCYIALAAVLETEGE